jgi:hypothetical protein
MKCDNSDKKLGLPVSLCDVQVTYVMERLRMSSSETRLQFEASEDHHHSHNFHHGFDFSCHKCLTRLAVGEAKRAEFPSSFTCEPPYIAP